MNLKGFTIAVTNMDAMVRFYNSVFHADLKTVDAFGMTLYRGTLAGYALTFCPNELLEIRAEKNRQQLSFYVDDLATTVQAVIQHGGGQLQAMSETAEGKSCGVADPDGNSIELTELAAVNTG